jgi:hypothetical protein
MPPRNHLPPAVKLWRHILCRSMSLPTMEEFEDHTESRRKRIRNEFNTIVVFGRVIVTGESASSPGCGPGQTTLFVQARFILRAFQTAKNRFVVFRCVEYQATNLTPAFDRATHLKLIPNIRWPCPHRLTGNRRLR